MATRSRFATVASTVLRLRPTRLSTMGRKVLINLAFLAALWLLLAALTPRFLGVENLTNVFRQIAVVATVGSVVTLLMVSRNYDLSVGGVLALSAALAATLAFSGWPVIAAFLAGIVAGMVVGALNGFLVVIVGINSVIATLGTLYLSSGAALILTNGLPVYSMPEGYAFVGAGYAGPIPMPVVIMAFFVLFMTVVERRSLLGKHARATGSNPEAAQLSGVPTRRVWLALFVASGAAAGWGGIMVSARTGGYSYTIGVGFEFQVIVACVLGGTSLAGGQGLVFGSMLGALIVGTLNNGMNLLLLPTFWQTVVLGVVLVLAVVLDAALRRRADRVGPGSGVESIRNPELGEQA